MITPPTPQFPEYQCRCNRKEDTLRLYLLVAASTNNVIGKDGSLPWQRLRSDKKHFRDLTLGHTVVMGRKTYESLRTPFKPLPDRRNIILTNQSNYQAPGAEVIKNWEELGLVVATEETVFVVGGLAVYKLALPQAEKIYLTRVLREYEGDIIFPSLDPQIWTPKIVQSVVQEEHDEAPMIFYEYIRRI